MQFIFLNMAGETLFIREDAERALWTQEEMTLEADFPYLSEKRISTGQRIYFKDPSTGSTQIYEVKQAKTQEPDHYQSVTAENICVSELSDEHTDNKEITDVKASIALDDLLTGTLWSVGRVDVNPVSSCDISRGSIWQGVLQIKDNWNVYIEPRLYISASGEITRYLDILPVEGEWNGVRLSIDKNMLDPSVTYDDSEVVTALYGYGGTIIAEAQDEEDKEVNFAEVVWTAGNGHPAKPYGQTYIEDPEATAAYGRDGRARFGFYQNTDITDAETLLQKTWESLRESAKPAISIEGTVADLYRLGYVDQPLKLHDIAMVEVLPAGYKDRVQIIRMTTDLLDQSSTTLTVGEYIPNIIYIERKTNEEVTGSRGGGGGNKSKQTERSEYETAIEKSNRKISLRAYQNDLDDLDNVVKLQEARIDIEHDRITMEVTDRRNADGELSSKITQTATEIRAEVKNEVEGLNSRITITAREIRTEVRNEDERLQSSITQNADRIAIVVDDEDNIKTASIVAGINDQTGSYVKIKADKINLSGYVTVSELEATDAKITNLTNGTTAAASIKTNQLAASSSFSLGGKGHHNSTITIGNTNYQIVTWS